MKKLLLAVCALLGFIACTQNPIEEQSAICTDVPETIKVGFEDSETRIQLNEAQKTVWTKDDLVSVFYLSNANQKWQYQGETGERVGNLKRVENATATAQTSKVVVVYPYRDDHYLNYESCNLHATLPATQYYTKGSYGVGSNLMVSQSEFTQFSLKSVCGWLKLQLTGDGEVVKSIKFRGNDGEQVAGLIYVDTATAEATLASEIGSSDDNNAGGNLIFDDTILTEVTLDCGDGVVLDEIATSFYIALPPQTFENGFTVDIECDGYKPMTLSTENELTIERNTIQPMASVECDATPNVPYNEIWYTNGSTTEPTTPRYTDVFGANIVSNTFDAEKECWVIKFDGDATTIGNWAFGYCSSLTSVTIPDSVTTIGDWVFYECSSLTSVTIPDSVTTIGEFAFYYCSSLTSVTIPNSVTTIGDVAFSDCSSLTSVTIPDSVTTIGNSVFSYCRSLTSVTIPDSVTTIGHWAFSDCSSLTSVTIPDSVTTIGDAVFAVCRNLREFNGKYASEDGRCLIIDGTLNSFAPAGLTEYTIPNSVTTIGERAFFGCHSLTSVTIPDSVTTIGDWVFYECSSLTSVTIPDSVTTIGEYAFYYCRSLTSVTIPDSVTTIGAGAFAWCSSLKSVYCKTVTPPTAILDYWGEWDAFDDNASGRKIYVPAESVEAYKSASYWSDYADAIVAYDFENGVVVTPKPANNEIWYTNGSTTEATTPYNTNVFGANIVSNTYDAAKECWVINFDGKVTTIGNWAFDYCYSLTSVTIPDSVTMIGDGTFRCCSSLTSVTIPDSVTTIGNYAFYKCSSLTSVTIPDSVTSIGEEAFSKCSNLQEFNGKFASEDGRCLIIYGTLNSFAPAGLTEYTIPDRVTTIGRSAFFGCESLTSITIPDNVTTIRELAFYECNSLTSVTIGDSVTSIGDWAFGYCSSLTSVTIGDSVTTIGYAAFANCGSLTSVYCKATTPPTTIVRSGYWCAFDENASGPKIYVPMESVNKYKSASGWSEYKSYIVGYNF